MGDDSKWHQRSWKPQDDRAYYYGQTLDGNDQAGERLIREGMLTLDNYGAIKWQRFAEARRLCEGFT